MRKYETFFIIDPDLQDDVNAVVDEKIKSVVTSNSGNVISYASWGKKKLAYTVKKRTRGHYILMEYAGGPDLVAELERNMRLDERVLKFITVKLEDRYDPEKEEERKAAATPPAFGEEEELQGGLSDVEEFEGEDLDEVEDESEDTEEE
ncbi:MAG: 30S ribosomal protein S6 [Syntrophobacteraceae bacterium]